MVADRHLGGPNTVIGDGDGVVVASADPTELGAAIKASLHLAA